MRPLPARRRELGVEPDPVADAEALDALAQVVEDLRLLGVAVRPVVLGGERERVEVARHVALAAGIGVGEPRAAHVGRALEHDEIVHAGLLQADRHSEATEARADYCDVYSPR